MGSELTNDVDPEALSAEEKYELKAAFGSEAVENGEIVEIDTDKLEPVETPEYPIRHVLEEGDWLTVQHKSGCVTTGPVYDVDRLWVKIEPKNRTTTSNVSYGDLKRYSDDEKGVVNELIDINGEPADRVIERRQSDD